MPEKFAFFLEEGSSSMKPILGGKGSGLSEMTSLGIPVPKGFTLSTGLCTAFHSSNGSYPIDIDALLREMVLGLEKCTGKTFGSGEKPLLLSVRSGAAVSMPGMMDTVLNLGLNDRTVEALAGKSNNRRFAFDAYRRFIQMFSDVVFCVKHELFESALRKKKSKLNASNDLDLDERALEELCVEFKKIFQEKTGQRFPQEPFRQLRLSVDAVFNSWNNKRAVTYRKLNKIPDGLGTAVTVQEMVFGNSGGNSATGVAFTRNPGTGENEFFGEFLVNAQGEDVVAGIRTPKPIKELEKEMPQIYSQLLGFRKALENHFKEMQDIEFTVEQGKLFILQTRNGKRTPRAAVKIAVDLAREGLISREEAVMRISPDQVNSLLHKTIDPSQERNAIAKGLPASPGAAVGRAVFSADKAEELFESGEKVVLVRDETSAEDIHGMNASAGILTVHGGMTSHASVVARGMGKPCVVGCEGISLNEAQGFFEVSSHKVKELDFISLDGETGEVFEGRLRTVLPKPPQEFFELMGWADSFRALKVRANADTPKDAKTARDFGAEGIGLCRTEHMFFGEDRIRAMREMVLSSNESERRKALEKILPFQKQDFIGIFKAMDGFPVTVRLLDPPLHEFLPKKNSREAIELAREMRVSIEALNSKIDFLSEVNPMLGHRGCRLGISFPEIYEVQARAILEAALELKKQGVRVLPEIMVPLTISSSEMRFLKELIHSVAEKVFNEKSSKVEFLVGTMIETPRAALTASEIAAEAEFFSFGTNDLTQMTLAFSRDDAGKFAPSYIEKGILPFDPFQSIDVSGVGQLVRICAENGRKRRPNLKIGICGEHGGDPASIHFCNEVGLDYVSCSPFRVPIARLAAAHAKIKQLKK